MVIQRAGVATATRVLVLADESLSRSDQEKDARTVMAVMTLNSLAPEVYTCAEVIDSKYDEHLRLAKCDEVILSRDSCPVLGRGHWLPGRALACPGG